MMKRLLLFIMIAATLLLGSFYCRAQETPDDVQTQSQQALFDLLDDETAQTLHAFAGDLFRPDKTFDVSTENITAFFAASLSETLKETGRLFFSLLALLLVFAAAQTLVAGTAAAGGVRVLCTCSVILLCVTRLQPVMNAVLSSMQVALTFMKGYVPIYTGILSLSGVPASATFYSSFVFAFAEILSAFCNHGCVTLLGCFFALLIAFSLSGTVSTARFVGGVNKALSVLLGFAATTFAAVLGVRGVLASSMDAASVKSVRFLLSSLIPVVGSAISDAYSAVLGSIHLIKGSVAVAGILVLLILLVPPLLQTVTLQFGFSLLAVAAELLDCADLAATLRGFGTGMRFLVLLSVFQLFVLLIATGVMLQVKGGN